MAKISGSGRNKYKEKTAPYRKAAESLLKIEQNMLDRIKEGRPDSALKTLTLSGEMLNLASNYLVQDSVSVSLLGVKSEDSLNNARKSIYKSIVYLEDVVGDALDVPFSDYEWRHDLIESVIPARRYALVRKMGLSITLLENAYGNNTKWKWTFVEMEGRFAAAAKNLINLRNTAVHTDPRSPHYEYAVFHLRLAKALLSRAADRYRERYELSTGFIDDFKMSITFLSALKRLNILTNSHHDAAIVKKKLDIWTNKLNSDINKMMYP